MVAISALEYLRAVQSPGNIELPSSYTCISQSMRCKVQVTPLQLACLKGDLALVKYLVSEAQSSVLMDVEEAPCSVAMDPVGPLGSPLHCACAGGHVDVVAYLVRRLNPKDHVNKLIISYGNESPLHLAARAGSIEIARMLVTIGANVGVTTGGENVDSVLTCAILAKQWAFVDWLRNTEDVQSVVPETNGHRQKFLFDVMTPKRYVQRPEFFESILKEGMQTGVFEPKQMRGGWTLVMNAVQRTSAMNGWQSIDAHDGDEEGQDGDGKRCCPQEQTIQLLKMLTGVDVDHTTPNASGHSPLVVARKKGLDEVASFLEGLPLPAPKRRRR